MDVECEVERSIPFDNFLRRSVVVMGNIVPDFPITDKSFNLGYSGHDLKTVARLSPARAMPTCCSSPGRCRGRWKRRCAVSTRPRL